MDQPRSGVSRRAGGWEGVVRIGRRVVARCGHAHRVRGLKRTQFETGAESCASDLLQTFGRRVPAYVEES